MNEWYFLPWERISLPQISYTEDVYCILMLLILGYGKIFVQSLSPLTINVFSTMNSWTHWFSGFFHLDQNNKHKPLIMFRKVCSLERKFINKERFGTADLIPFQRMLNVIRNLGMDCLSVMWLWTSCRAFILFMSE